MFRTPTTLDTYYMRRVPTAGGPTWPFLTASLHLDASAITGKNNGDSVTSWPDTSGNGRDFTVATGLPLYTTGVSNGLPGVDFESGIGLKGTYAISSGSLTLAVVGKLTSTTNGSRRAVQGSNNWLIGPYSNSWKYYNGAFIDSAVTLQTTAAVMFMATQTATGGAIYSAPGSSSTNGNGTFPGTIGLGVAGGYNEAFLGYLCEVVFWESILSSTDITNTFAALKQKWGI